VQNFLNNFAVITSFGGGGEPRFVIWRVPGGVWIFCCLFLFLWELLSRVSLAPAFGFSWWGGLFSYPRGGGENLWAGGPGVFFFLVFLWGIPV